MRLEWPRAKEIRVLESIPDITPTREGGIILRWRNGKEPVYLRLTASEIKTIIGIVEEKGIDNE